MGAGPIPGLAIRSYAKANGVSDPEVFSRIIWAMDDVYVSHSNGEGKVFSRDMLKR